MNTVGSFAKFLVFGWALAGLAAVSRPVPETPGGRIQLPERPAATGGPLAF